MVKTGRKKLVMQDKTISDTKNNVWSKLPVEKKELNLEIVLKCGQSFRWTQSEDEWIGVLKGHLYVLKQTEKFILYKVLPGIIDESHQKILEDYFQLQIKLEPMYDDWAKVDPVFDGVREQFAGVRMLRQDPVENVFSFICSSNNNIQRISGMVENLCLNYGQIVCEYNGKPFYRFPYLEELAQDGVDQRLRELGFGYRSSYISKTAKQMIERGGEPYLHGLRNMPYEQAKKELLQFTGIGPKVADCILLMSLDKPSAIPVDTHMFQIAANKYLPHLKGYKSVTDKVYSEISQHFQKLYGDYAGWAHSVLFSADLRHLKDVGQEMEPVARKKQKVIKSS